MEKTILLGLIITCLMICTPLAQAKKHMTDTEQAGVASDSKGRVCNFGPNHDECYDQFIKHTSAQTNSEKHITEGVIVITYNVPNQGINLIYRYIDEAPGTGGVMYVNLTGADDGLFQWIEGTRDSDAPYHPGDKFTVSVSRYVPNGFDSTGIPQPVLDSKTITLGETGGIVTLFLPLGIH